MICLKYEKDIYSDYIGDGSSRVKLRAGDGIHFSLKGQQIICSAGILAYPSAKVDDVPDDVTDKNMVTPNGNN